LVEFKQQWDIMAPISQYFSLVGREDS
jgi:hypothetical protein